MSSRFKVVIVGLGIAGAVTAILLERAGIDYIVLERAPSFRRTETGTSLNAQTLRLFEQLGLLEQLLAAAVPVRQIAFYRQNLQLLTTISLQRLEEKHGYPSIMVTRADLMSAMLSAIPPERIQWNKRVLDVTEYRDCVSVKTQDGIDYDGQIVIGADGAYSAVRHHLFKNLKKRGHIVPESDLNSFRFEMFATVGTAQNLDRWMYKTLRETSADMMAIVSDNGPHTTWLLPLKGEKISWLYGSKEKEAKKMHSDHTFRLSEWDLRADESVYQQARDVKLPIAGTLGDLIDKTNHDDIVQVMVDEKCFKTWFSDRVVLMGDGATQAILDAVCLVNLLHEMPKNNADETRAIFATYYDLRLPVVQSAFQSSNMLAGLAIKTGKVANVTRTIATKLIPQSFLAYSLDKMLVHRPIASFLPPPPTRGKIPPQPQSEWRIYQHQHSRHHRDERSSNVAASSYTRSGTSYTGSSLSLSSIPTAASSAQRLPSWSQNDLTEPMPDVHGNLNLESSLRHDDHSPGRVPSSTSEERWHTRAV
ncbi:hypothetical protein BGW41_001011 [Actinomortierella wolfii]|nr:hypothetical protein BGW41_001011 [Actinomortierella wolfii]